MAKASALAQAQILCVDDRGIQFRCCNCRKKHRVVVGQDDDIKLVSGIEYRVHCTKASKDTARFTLRPLDDYQWEISDDGVALLPVGRPSSHKNSALTDDLTSLTARLASNLTLCDDQEHEDQVVSSDIPIVAMMTIFKSRKSDSLWCDYSLRFLDPATRKTTCSIPYIRVRSTKASGVLCRGGNLPALVAVSGWSEMFENEYQINNLEWSAKALEMCEVLDHKAERHRNDRDYVGQYNLAHVEAQFLAYVAFRHVVSVNGKGMGRLKRLAHLVELDEIWIYVDRMVCDSCTRLIERFGAVFGMQVVVIVKGVQIM